MLQPHPEIGRHGVVEATTGIQILAMQPGQLAAQREAAGMRTLGQQPVTGHIGTQQACILVT